MSEELLDQLASAVILALSRVDLVRVDQIRILEVAAERLRVTEDVDQSALLQLVTEAGAN